MDDLLPIASRSGEDTQNQQRSQSGSDAGLPELLLPLKPPDKNLASGVALYASARRQQPVAVGAETDTNHPFRSFQLLQRRQVGGFPQDDPPAPSRRRQHVAVLPPVQRVDFCRAGRAPL